MEERMEGNKGTEKCKNRGKQSFLTRRCTKEMTVGWTNKTVKEKGRKEINMRRGYRRGRRALFCLSWLMRWQSRS
jgi:hypothetical protein